jgi:predicted HTH domain antitoxin
MTDMHTIHIPQDILDSARLTVPEVQQELALWLYAQGRLGIGKARELAGMSLWEFRQLLSSRKISPHYEINELEEDKSTLDSLKKE